MNARISVLVSMLALSFSVVACDDSSTKDVKPSASASASTTTAATAPSATATTTTTASADPPKKRDVVCPTGDTVQTDNPALLAEIKRKLSKKPDDTVKMSELQNVKSLNLTQAQKFDELDPCIFPKLVNLHDLFLPAGDLADLSPITNLNQLLTVRVSLTKVSDLKPLEKLAQLDRLDIGHIATHDITSLAQLTNLTELELDGDDVRDLTPLAKCTKLEKLSIKNMPVTDVSPLKTLTKLKWLYIEGTPISDTSPLQPLVGHGLHIVTSGR